MKIGFGNNISSVQEMQRHAVAAISAAGRAQHGSRAEYKPSMAASNASLGWALNSGATVLSEIQNDLLQIKKRLPQA